MNLALGGSVGLDDGNDYYGVLHARSKAAMTSSSRDLIRSIIV